MALTSEAGVFHPISPTGTTAKEELHIVKTAYRLVQVHVRETMVYDALVL